MKWARSPLAAALFLSDSTGSGLARHPEAGVRLNSNFDRHPEVRVLFTRLEGCTSPVAASFEGRAAMVRHFPEALRLARPPQMTGQGRTCGNGLPFANATIDWVSEKPGSRLIRMT